MGNQSDSYKGEQQGYSQIKAAEGRDKYPVKGSHFLRQCCGLPIGAAGFSKD